jgi:hypothetical protein
MKKFVKLSFLLLSLIATNAFADVSYKCHSVQSVDKYPDTILKISTGLFSGKINSVKLVSEMKILTDRNFVESENPFLTDDANYLEVEEQTIRDTTDLNFKALKKEGMSSVRISLSDSLLKFGKSGYAHYYGKTCILWGACEGRADSYYFKCDNY